MVRATYETCTFQALLERLRCKEIWVVGADRWRNPDEDLPADFEDRRVEHYTALRKPLDPTAFINELQGELAAELTALNEQLPRWRPTRPTSGPLTRTSSPSGTPAKVAEGC